MNIQNSKIQNSEFKDSEFWIQNSKFRALKWFSPMQTAQAIDLAKFG